MTRWCGSSRAHVLAPLPHVMAVKVPGAHALNFTAPELVADLIEAHLADEPLTASSGPRQVVETITITSAT